MKNPVNKLLRPFKVHHAIVHVLLDARDEYDHPTLDLCREPLEDRLYGERVLSLEFQRNRLDYGSASDRNPGELDVADPLTDAGENPYSPCYGGHIDTRLDADQPESVERVAKLLGRLARERYTDDVPRFRCELRSFAAAVARLGVPVEVRYWRRGATTPECCPLDVATSLGALKRPSAEYVTRVHAVKERPGCNDPECGDTSCNCSHASCPCHPGVVSSKEVTP